MRPPAVIFDLTGGFGRAVLVVEIGDHDVGALGREFDGGSLTDPGIGARDCGNPIGELGHVDPLVAVRRPSSAH